MTANSTTTNSTGAALLKPTEAEIDALSWIWVALPSVASQIPPPLAPVDPSTLSDEERKEYDDKQRSQSAPPSVLDAQAMFATTMKRALGCREFEASCSEIIQTLLPSIHRACFPNADVADNRAAAELIAAQESEHLVQHEQISLRDFAHVLFRRAVHPAGWFPAVDFVAFANDEAADAKDDGAKSAAGGGAAAGAGDRRGTRGSRHLSSGTPRGQVSTRCATPLVKQFRDLAYCILDAPNLTTEPKLLPLERVLSLSGSNFENANKVPVELKTFVDLDPTRDYPKIFDDMWDAIVAASTKKAQGTKNNNNNNNINTNNGSESTFEGFRQWFSLFLSFTVPNSMEERSRVAAKAHFDEAYAVTMSFDKDRFRQTAQELFRFYTKRLVVNVSSVAHYERMMNLADGDIVNKRLDPQQSQILPSVLEKLKFTTTDELYAADNLDAEQDLEETVYPAQTQNRILVTGFEGLVSLDFCKQLAHRLNVEHIDVLELLISAYDDAASSEAALLRGCIDDEKPIPLELQASLVRKALSKESTKFRGYVFGELPPALEGDGNFVTLFLTHSGLCDSGATPPRVIIEAACPASYSNDTSSGGLYKAWRAKYRDEVIAAKYSEELAIRDQEFADQEAKKAKSERHDAARKRREEREENREKIARGEIAPPSDEELEHEARQDAEDQALLEQQEEEIDPDTVDENGVPVDPETLLKVKAAKAAAKKRRSDIAEIHRLYHASRTCDLSAAQAPAHKEDATLRAIVDLAKNATQKYLRLACFDAPETLVDFACAHLHLVPVITPKIQSLPADVLAMGYESTPEADAAAGEQLQQELLQAGFRRSAYGDFCPVSKLDDSVLVSGTWFYSCSYREYCYCFASNEKLNKFCSNPNKYLSQDVNSRAPVLLVQESFDVLEQAGISPSQLHSILGERLKLSCRSLSNFADSWHRFDAEVARRAEIETRRRQTDQAERKDREARLKAATAEAELAAKKNARSTSNNKARAPASSTSAAAAATSAKPGGRATAKGAASTAAAAAALAEQQRREKELAAAHEKANAVNPIDVAEMQDRLARAQAALIEQPHTTETLLAARVAAEQRRAQNSMRPLIVSALEAWNVDDISAFRARHVIPDVVVCFQNVKPAVLDADGNPVANDDEDVEDLDRADAEVSDSNHNHHHHHHHQDPSLDPHKSRRFWNKFLTELDEESATVLGETAGGAAAAAPGHDGNPQQQAFRVIRVNVHDVPLDTIVDTVLYAIREIGFKCEPGSGELNLDDDDDEGADDDDDDDEEHAALLASNPLIERRDPILRPHPRAVHQFGETSTYCPVALVRDGLLVQGDPSIWVQLNGRKFMFATGANMEAFKLLPKRYIPAAAPQPAPLPPPRVWLLGPVAAGKDSLANQLVAEFGLRRFSTKPEKLLAYLAAATEQGLSDEERVVDGVFVPLQLDAPFDIEKPAEFQRKHLAEAIEIKKQLDEFAKDQGERRAKKAEAEKDLQEREQWIDDGEQVDELTEAQQAAQQAAIDWEPEDDEARIERLALAHRRLAASLSRVEPWATQGYILVGAPTSDSDLVGLLDAQMIPETVIRLTLGVEAFVERRFRDELAARQAEFDVKIRNFRMKQSALQLFARVAEVTKWRRRNIGADDVANLDPPELEDAENEPEPVDVDAVRGDLEQKFEASVAEVEALIEILPDRRIPVVTLRGDDGPEALLASAKTGLARNLTLRASLLDNPQVITVDEADSRLETLGRNLFSAFGKEDPVVLFERRRHGLGQDLLWVERGADNKDLVLEEPAYVEPAPSGHDDGHKADSKKSKRNNNNNNNNNEELEKPTKKKIVEDEDGNEMEVTDHDDDDEDEEDEGGEHLHEVDDEEHGDAPDEEDEPPADPFADLEEYPADLSPEEIEEMQAELNALRKKRADRRGRRACILRNRVYYFDNDRSLKKFVAGDCRRYYQQPPPLPSVLGNVVVVHTQQDDAALDDTIRTIQSISRNANNAVYISLPTLVEWGCNQSHFPRLRDEAIDFAISAADPREAGVDVPSKWIEEALPCRLLSSDVRRRGCVLCNLPATVAQLNKLLASEPHSVENSMIHAVLVFNASAESSITATVSVNTLPAETEARAAVARELGKTNRCVHYVKSATGTSRALHEAQSILAATFEARRRLVVARKLGFPLVVDSAALTESFILGPDARCPQYSYYCPWTWARESRLLERDPKSDLLRDPSCTPRNNVVEFLSKLYFFSDSRERIQEFLSFPERFIGKKFRPKALPSVLPHRLVTDTKCSTASSSAIALDSVREEQIELCGFCPVVLCDTRHNRGLMGLVEPKAVPGQKQLLAEYDGKFYSMSTEENVQRFLSEPWTFVDGAVLPAADQFPQQGNEGDLQSSTLEMFLRRALRESVARAMCDVERIRPKFPGLSVQQSALRFVALHIRAHHPDPNQTEFSLRVHRENYEQFVELATMAREGGLVPPHEDAPQEVKESFNKRCKMWDSLLDDPQAFYDRFSGLRTE